MNVHRYENVTYCDESAFRKKPLSGMNCSNCIVEQLLCIDRKERKMIGFTTSMTAIE